MVGLRSRQGFARLRLPLLAAVLAVPIQAAYPQTFRAALDGFRTGGGAAVEKAYLREANGTGKDRLLALYELGAFAHLAGDYPKSIDLFKTADAVARDYEGQAVVSAGAAARTAGAVLLNDTVLKYEGHGFEKVMSRTLNAINYLMAGDLEGARVELRKAEEYQRLERERHQKEVQKAGAKDADRLGSPAVLASHGQMFNSVKAVRNSFENAFTYYLASQIHLTQGVDGLNDAMVAIRHAYELAPQAPAVRAAYLEIAAAQGGQALDRARADLKEAGPAPLRDPRGTASVLVCYEAGLMPELEQVKISLPAANQIHSAAVPVYRNLDAPQPSVSVTGLPSAEPVVTTPVLDTRALAAKSLQERMPAILARSLAGVAAKAEVQKQVKNQFGLFGGLVASVATSLVTEADLRSWLSLPAQVQVAKYDFPPGPATLTVAGPGWVQPVAVNPGPGSTTFLVVRAIPGFRRVDAMTVEGSLVPVPADPGQPGAAPAAPEPAGPGVLDPAPAHGEAAPPVLLAAVPAAPDPVHPGLLGAVPPVPEPAGPGLPGAAPAVPEPAGPGLPGPAPAMQEPAGPGLPGATPAMPGPAAPGLPAAAPSAPAPAGTVTPGPAEPAPAPPAWSEPAQAAIGPLEAGKAQVVFFRPGKLIGAAIGFIVREQDRELGKLRNGNYFVIHAEPGPHTFTVHSEASEHTTLDLEAGKTYFVSGSIKIGILVGRPHLTRTEPAAFEEALPKLKPSKPLG